MITIETIDTYVTPAEKLKDCTKPVVVRKDTRVVDRLVAWANSQHHSLIQAAHQSRLLKSARHGGLSIDVQRYCEHQKTDTLTMVERYVKRLV